MAGRWRSAQRRKRWTDNAALLPQAALDSLKPWPALQPLGEQLESFGQQLSTYAQLAKLKNLGNTLLASLQLSQEEVRVSFRVFAELLFVENSRPLHRGLLSTLSHVPSAHVLPLLDAFQKCCLDYGFGGSKERRFSVVAVSASLASLPQPGVMKQVARHCAPSMGSSISHDVQVLLKHSLDGGRPTPSAMEECQDALSSIYYLLQQFPDKFSASESHTPSKFVLSSGGSTCDSRDQRENLHSNFVQRGRVAAIQDGASESLDTSECREHAGYSDELQAMNCHPSDSDYKSSSKDGGNLYGEIVSLLLDVLQTAVLSRDCLVAAGVGLSAAAQFGASTEGLAVLLANTAFSADSEYAMVSPDEGLSDCDVQRGMLEAAVVAVRKSTLRAEVEKFSDFGKLCFLRGVLTSIPRNAQNVHLLRTTYASEKSESSVASDQGFAVGKKESRREAWTVLYDGILPALCGFCESSVDSHFKFHAVTAMQICLQQIKTSICGHLTLSSFNYFEQSAIQYNVSVQPYDPLPAATISRVLKLIWNNWEDPLTQTVKQVQVVFDLLVDVQLVHKREMYHSQSIEETLHSNDARLENEQVGIDSFLRQIASDLLAAGKFRKGKYVPLASLVLRIGARKMLHMSPDLLFNTIDAFSDDDVCSSASTFLKTFLERLREDCWSDEGVMKGTVLARRSWIPAVLSGLLNGDPRLRNNLTTYAVPVVMQIDRDSLLVILAYILEGSSKADGIAGSSLSWEELKGVHGMPGHLTVEQQVVLLISVLKVARSAALVDGSIEQKLKPSDKSVVEVEDQYIDTKTILGMSPALFCIQNQVVEVPVGLLLLALTHREDGLRVDAAELMCLNPKTASMPSRLELCLLRIALPLNMRCSSTAFRMRWTSFLKKFFLRVRTAVERQQKSESLLKSQLKHIEPMSLQDEKKSERSFTPILKNSSDENASCSGVSLEKMQEFMQWLSQLLVSSLYPSAPYERKNMAMEVFNALIEVWSLKQSWEKRSAASTLSPHLNTQDFSPYHESLLSVDFTLVVVGAVVDSWDRLREGAYKILIRYPTPLPGLDSESTVEGLLTWAKGMVNSPRVRESDAGALSFRLIFRKYVVELGWLVKVHPEPKVVITSASCTDFELGLGEVVVQYLESLNDWLQWGIEEGEKDLLKACAHSFVHGVLLVLRYTVEEIDWTSVGVQTCSNIIRAALARLLALLLKVTSLALWVVSADALNLQEKLGGPSLPGCMLHEDDSSESDGITPVIETVDEEYGSDVEESLAPAEQIVMVGCWLSVKEVSLLLGTMARVVPLPGNPSDSKVERNGGNETPQRPQIADTNVSSAMLDGKQLEAIGSHFVEVLLSMKHNGAIDKTRTGFIALCDRLLRSSDSWLNKLPEVWLQQLMQHTGAKGQVVDDLLRRSAGIPPAFLALFLAEPDGAPKKLLPIAMKWLIDTCKGFLNESSSQGQVMKSKLDLSAANVEEIDLLRNKELAKPRSGKVGEDGAVVALKSRDEGVVPTVHAFNILRMTFHDTNLATDTSGFCAEGLITAIQAFASSYWEVRNSATLTFTALVHRTIGFLNVYKRESARRAITGFEFFHRYPTLHPFLLKELQSATWQLEHGVRNGPNEESGLANLLHPSLGPVLIILSRLKPSFINSDVEDWLNPSAFMPYVTRCATQRNLHVRVLASRALVPLVSSDDLLGVLLQLAESLPVVNSSKGTQMANNDWKLSVVNKGVAGGLPSNAIHGVLLQMYTLLTANCISLPDVDMRSKIVILVSQIVEERLWLGSIRFCSCYMVVGAFLDMLGGLLSLAEVCQEKLSDPDSFISYLQQLLTELSCGCLDDSIENMKFQDPTRVALREKAVKVYFQTTLLQGSFDKPSSRISDEQLWSKEKDAVLEHHVPATYAPSVSVGEKFGPLTSRLKQGLVDHSYEVRLATLKVLKQHSDLLWTRWEQSCELTGKSEESSLDSSFLRPFIIARLSSETHPRCMHRILQVIYKWTLIDTGKKRIQVNHSDGRLQKNDSVWGSGLSGQELWCCLLNIYNTTKQIKTKEVAVQCLGGCLQQLCVGIIDEIESDDLTRGSRFMLGKRFVFDKGQNVASQIYALPTSVISSGSDDKQPWRFKEIINMWLDIARLHSAASEPVNFRRATAEAIVASGLLADANWIGLKLAQELNKGDAIQCSGSLQGLADLEWYGQAVLSAWCMCIKLLEDEDQDLRQKLALSILNVIASSDFVANDVVPAQVEKVIQVSFEFLSAQFGDWRNYYDVLAEWVLGTKDDTDVLTGDVDLVRRLFDKEIDNHHEEGLLFVQLCCLHLQKLVNGSRNHPDGQPNLVTSRNTNSGALLSCSSLYLSDEKKRFQTMSAAPWYHPFLQKWRMRFLERVNLCAKISVQIKDRMEWVGGVTNHQDTFRILYSSLLGLLLFVGPKGDVEGLITPANSVDERNLETGLVEASGLLRQLSLNPLVSNLLVQVLQTYEQQLHVDLCSSELRSILGDALCVNFEPLFLIT